MYEDPTGRFGLLATLGLIAIGDKIGAINAIATGVIWGEVSSHRLPIYGKRRLSIGY